MDIKTLDPIITITPPIPKAKNYLNNKDLLANVISSKKKGAMSNELALMLQTLTKRYAKKGNFAGYTYNEDMQAYAMLMLCKTWSSFDPAKSDNPFAFFTQCIKNSFIQYLNTERKVRDIKNRTLIDSGFNPSHSFMVEYEGEFHERREMMLDSDVAHNVRPDDIIIKEVIELIDSCVQEDVIPSTGPASCPVV